MKLNVNWKEWVIRRLPVWKDRLNKELASGRFMLLGVLALAIALIVGTVGTIGAIAQLTPSQIPPPAPSRPIPNDPRQPLIPGRAPASSRPSVAPASPESPPLPGSVSPPGTTSAPGNRPSTATTPAAVPPSSAADAPPKPAADIHTTLPGNDLPYPILRDLPNARYTPRQEIAPANPTNYGYRFLTDALGNPVTNAPIIVLHETVGSASSAINTFRAAQLRDADQRSYHALIRRNGTVVYIVPPEYRAFGAGNSVFVGANGPEAVLTNPQFPPSVNNFAYHISLETPSDGRGNGRQHSGYTQAQYQALGWLVARTGIPSDRITTHRAVDRSGSRLDPRSFDGQQFLRALQTFAQAG